MHVTYHGNITKQAIAYHWQAHITYQLTTGTITKLIKEGHALTKNQAHHRIEKAIRNNRNKATRTNQVDIDL